MKGTQENSYETQINQVFSFQRLNVNKAIRSDIVSWKYS